MVELGASGTAGVMLRADSLVKRFGGLTAVDTVSLDVREGEILGLIGPNGAGKTTLFNLLAGAMRPDSGTITLFGSDLTRAGAAAMCEAGLSRTFQNPRPFGRLTVQDNAAVGGLARGTS